MKETAKGTCSQLQNLDIDEGIIGSFMSGRFLKQANLPGFLPYMVPALQGKPCTAVEGACGTGGRAIAMAARSVLSDLSDVVFVAGFEMQNVIKSVYGADVLAGAGYYAKERKPGDAFFFPGIFAKRAGTLFSSDEGRESPKLTLFIREGKRSQIVSLAYDRTGTGLKVAGVRWQLFAAVPASISRASLSHTLRKASQINYPVLLNRIAMKAISLSRIATLL